MIFNVFGAVLASIAWLACSLLLLLLSDGFTFDVKLIASHIVGDYSILFVGLLILIDVALDTYIVGNPEGLVKQSPTAALAVILLCTIGVPICCAIASFTKPNLTDIDLFCAGIAIFLLFLVRTMSYVKVKQVNLLAGGERFGG